MVPSSSGHQEIQQENSNDSHHRDCKNILEVHLKAQKTANNQGNTEQKQY
jgi:hypothetical protein